MKNAAVKSVKFGCMDNMLHTRGVGTKTGTVARIDPAIQVARVIGHNIRHDANEIVSVTCKVRCGNILGTRYSKSVYVTSHGSPEYIEQRYIICRGAIVILSKIRSDTTDSLMLILLKSIDQVIVSTYEKFTKEE